MKTLSGSPIHILRERLPGQDACSCLLQGRGIFEGTLAAEKFLSPSLDSLYDPFLLPDMQQAIERILRAREAQERVMIFGDYDADGVSSVALLFRFMKLHGWNVSFRLPHREKDGYGFKPHFVEDIHEKNVKLIITLDCGTKDAPTITEAKKKGMDVVVIDHHWVPEELPKDALAVVNPHRKDSLYPFPHLSAAGLALKTVQALSYRLFSPEEAYEKIQEYVDFALIGTVADCMPLVDENRIITAIGLQKLKTSPSAILRHLFSEHNRPLDADFIGFRVGPLINAAGRMDTPLKALQLLLANTENMLGILEEIEELNNLRRQETLTAVARAKQEIDTEKSVIIWRSPETRHGIIGLVAARLCQDFGKPAIILHDAGEKLVASVRSPKGFSTLHLLEQLKQHFVVYGGHAQAGGFTLLPEKWEEFLIDSERASKEISLTTPREIPLSIDMILEVSEVQEKLCSLVQSLAPFGIGNEKPLFLFQNISGTIAPLGKDGKHISLTTQEKVRINGFGMAKHEDILKKQETFSFIGEIGINIWNNRKSYEITIKDFVENPSGKVS